MTRTYANVDMLPAPGRGSRSARGAPCETGFGWRPCRRAAARIAGGASRPLLEAAKVCDYTQFDVPAWSSDAIRTVREGGAGLDEQNRLRMVLPKNSLDFMQLVKELHENDGDEVCALHCPRPPPSAEEAAAP